MTFEARKERGSSGSSSAPPSSHCTFDLRITGSVKDSEGPSTDTSLVERRTESPSPVSDVATWSRRSFSRSESLVRTGLGIWKGEIHEGEGSGGRGGIGASPVSDYSDEWISASELASSEYFDEWRRGTPLAIPLTIGGGGTRWDAFPVPQVIRNLGNYLIDVRLPEWVFQAEDNPMHSSQYTQNHKISPLHGSRLIEMFVEDNAYFQSSFERVMEESVILKRLSSNWQHQQRIKGGELGWRIPVDNVVRKAFVCPKTGGVECDFVCDVPVSMLHSSSSLSTRVDKFVIADTMISTSLYPSPSMFNLDAQVFEELRVDRERPGHDSAVICIPHLVVRYIHEGTSITNSSLNTTSTRGNHRREQRKYQMNAVANALNDATNELSFLFGAGMHQRRLLGFEREPMFGVACSFGKVRVFASYWKDNQIQIVRLYSDDLDLLIPEQACLFFMLLLRIRHIIASFQSQLESLNNGTEIERRVKQQEGSWKAEGTYPPPPGARWDSRRRMTGWSYSTWDMEKEEEGMDVDEGSSGSTGSALGSASTNDSATGSGFGFRGRSTMMAPFSA